MAESEYSKKLRDPRWQKKRLEILERDAWSCRFCACATETLHVHHTYYEREADPWDYPSEHLLTLCETCHEREHSQRGKYEQQLLHALRLAGVSADILWEIADFVTCHFPPAKPKVWFREIIEEALFEYDAELKVTVASAVHMADSGAVDDLPFPEEE